ncbi:hypothetical protein NFI96_004418, partial [Prochilodus magdalenae]
MLIPGRGTHERADRTLVLSREPACVGTSFYWNQGTSKDMPNKEHCASVVKLDSSLTFPSSPTSLHCSLHCSLHWLPVVARIRFKILMISYKAQNGPAPPYFMAMVQSGSVPRALRALNTAPPAIPEDTRKTSVQTLLCPGSQMELPLAVQTGKSLVVSRLKTHLFILHLGISSGPGLP